LEGYLGSGSVPAIYTKYYGKIPGSKFPIYHIREEFRRSQDPFADDVSRKSSSYGQLLSKLPFILLEVQTNSFKSFD
jgi:hypothetical protein